MSNECGPADFWRWLNALVYRMTGPDDPNHDDLVQEGLVAMWRAEETYDPSRGAKASWLVRAAEMRVRAVAFGRGQPFGHEARRGVKRPPAPVYLEELQQADEDFEPWACEIAEGVAMAYHFGEVHQALCELSPAQKVASLKVMYDQAMTGADRAHWVRAKAKLQNRLQHLSDC